MKIKQICERTGLTDRAVRFYVEKGLLTPKSDESNGRTYYEFEEPDVLELNAIASFRRAGFSIEEIHLMQTNPRQIDEVLFERRKKLAEQAAVCQENLEKLETIIARFSCNGLEKDYLQVAWELEKIPLKNRTSKPFSPEEFAPNFGRFDEESAEEKAAEYRKFLGHQYLRNRKSEKWGRWAPAMDFFAKTITRAAAAGILIFLVWLIAVSIPKRVGNLWKLEEKHAVRIWLCETGESSDFSQAEVMFTADSSAYREICDILKSTWYFGSVFSMPRRSAASEGWGKNIWLSIWADEKTKEEVEIFLSENGYFWICKNGWCYRYYLGINGTQNYEKIIAEMEDVFDIHDK